MSDQSSHETPRPRGEAAWKAEKDRVAARNTEARRAGKQERRAEEEKAAKRRRAVDRNERASLPAQPIGKRRTG